MSKDGSPGLTEMNCVALSAQREETCDSSGHTYTKLCDQRYSRSASEVVVSAMQITQSNIDRAKQAGKGTCTEGLPLQLLLASILEALRRFLLRPIFSPNFTQGIFLCKPSCFHLAAAMGGDGEGESFWLLFSTPLPLNPEFLLLSKP